MTKMNRMLFLFLYSLSQLKDLKMILCHKVNHLLVILNKKNFMILLTKTSTKIGFNKIKRIRSNTLSLLMC